LIQSVTINQVYQNRLFVADTLWFHQHKLDAIGETKIVVPDSIFPDASLNYKAVISFINADSERQTKELSLQFDSKLPPVRFEVKNDSVWFLPQSITHKIELTALTVDDDEIFTKEVSLPHSERISPLIKEYEAGISPDWEFLEMSAYDKLEVLSSRTADSITIWVNNPGKFHFITRYSTATDNSFAGARVNQI
jgi:alpha-2-macroglobulin